MRVVVESFTLDVAKPGSQHTFYAKIADVQSRGIRVRIVDKNKPFPLEKLYGVFIAKKPDDTNIIADCFIEVDEDGSETVTCTLPSQTFTCAGPVKCEIMLYDLGANQITSPQFEYIVNETGYDEEELVSSDEYAALTAALAEARKYQNITVETETLQPEEPAYADGELTEEGFHLTFGIPKGDRGDPGEGGAGTGDMLARIYDPQGKQTDIFNYIDEHIDDKENPHEVTAEQAGAVPNTFVLNGHTLDGESLDLTAGDVGAVSNSFTINGKQLSGDSLDLAPADVGAVSTTISSSTSVTSGWDKLTVANCRVFKMGRLAHLALNGTISASESTYTSGTFATVPSGYRPGSTIYFGNAEQKFYLNSNGIVGFSNARNVLTGSFSLQATYVIAN